MLRLLSAHLQAPAQPCRAGPPHSALQRPSTQPLQPPADAPRSSSSWGRCGAACLAALALLAPLPPLPPPPPAAASIPLAATSDEAQRAKALSQLASRYAARTSGAAPPAADSTSARIARLQELMAAGNAAAEAGDYAAALARFDSVIQQFGGEFATVEYSRLARAKALYQLGRVSDAILQLEDLEVSLRGYAEVHAALAAILYVERPALLNFAETQFEIALEFQPQFSDKQWVASTKKWPPRLMAALDRFLTLS